MVIKDKLGGMFALPEHFRRRDDVLTAKSVANLPPDLWIRILAYRHLLPHSKIFNAWFRVNCTARNTHCCSDSNDGDVGHVKSTSAEESRSRNPFELV